MLSTLNMLRDLGVAVRVQALDGTDLNSSAERFMLQMLAAVAELERNLIRERTAAAQARFVEAGGKLGRPRLTTDEQRAEICQLLDDGMTVTATASAYGVSRATVINIRDSVAHPA